MKETNLFVGLSICSPFDNFSRVTGRKIAEANFNRLMKNIQESKNEGSWNPERTEIVMSGNFITGFNIPGKELKEMILEAILDGPAHHIFDFSNVKFLNERVFATMDANAMMAILLNFLTEYSENIGVDFPEHAYPKKFQDEELFYPRRMTKEMKKFEIINEAFLSEDFRSWLLSEIEN